MATSRGGGAVDLQRRRAVAMGGGDEQGRLLGRSAATMGGGDKQGRWHRRAAWRRLCSLICNWHGEGGANIYTKGL